MFNDTWAFREVTSSWTQSCPVCELQRVTQTRLHSGPTKERFIYLKNPMASFREVTPMVERGSDKEPPAQEDAAVEVPYHRTAERRHVDVLLDISEEDFLKELEPHEYHCYSGWEEAVRGWARVAPLSCILLTQKNQRKLKHKEADNQNPVDLTHSNADSSASVAEHHCESHAGFSYSSKKSTFLNPQPESWHDAALAALQLDAPEWTLLNDMSKIPSQLLGEEKIEEEKMLGETHLESYNLSSKYSLSQYKPTKAQKHSHGPISTVVPIRNFTFLPLVVSPYLNHGHLCTGKTSSEGELLDENGFTFDKKSRTRGTRVEPLANAEFSMNSKYRTCQHGLSLYSAVRVPVPKRYHIPISPKADTVNRTGYSLGKSLTPGLHSSTAVGSARLHPSYLFS
ncbi:hypothetical protein Q5P01_006778 [Channa striata]|uniref:Uncharacterized protein n=1 Tax=Channa striata TaxID=64152 RepID=A0AA88SX99_CHASR|nr:hypothetical protein Q5P01_006778 [Channa striata]